ncbi:MAG: DUF3106 domain-containing protein [Burkholderiales bacterium]
MHSLLPAVLAALLLMVSVLPAGAAPKDRGPAWAALTADQQQILAPLSGEWNKMGLEHKRKWLGIAKRYPKMKPEVQKRVQGRMQRWAKLTPEQRWQAREQYRSIGKLTPDGREELRRYWAEYQALPANEKHMFDVPPTYVKPAQRRAHSTPAKKVAPAKLPPLPH